MNRNNLKKKSFCISNSDLYISFLRERERDGGERENWTKRVTQNI